MLTNDKNENFSIILMTRKLILMHQDVKRTLKRVIKDMKEKQTKQVNQTDKKYNTVKYILTVIVGWLMFDR